MHPDLIPHIQTIRALQPAILAAKKATGLCVGAVVKQGKFQVGFATDLPNGNSIWTALSAYQSLPATLAKLRQISEDATLKQ